MGRYNEKIKKNKAKERKTDKKERPIVRKTRQAQGTERTSEEMMPGPGNRKKNKPVLLL
jgi:hypothetical protein